MELVHKYNLAHHYHTNRLLHLINALAGLSIFFFGYDQGMMGGVNNAEDYYDRTMHFGHKDPETGAVVVTNTLLQGGIVSAYYLGTLIGCFIGGSIGDTHGRIKSIALGAFWAVIGALFQASAQSARWMICARLLNGFGTGILNAIIPVYASEISPPTTRGSFIAQEFTLNIFGVCSAYWLSYALSRLLPSTSPFLWRFPIAFQIVPLLVLFVSVWIFPESPRWLAKVGREGEGRWVLGRLRGENGGEVEGEWSGVVGEVEVEKKSAGVQNYVTMFFGTGEGSEGLHIGRRVQLVIWLQVMQEWIGIAGVTVYAPTIFRIAGIGNGDSGWVSGLNNTVYMFSTLICVFTLDRIGRRWTLYWGSVGMAISMFAAGTFSRLGIKNAGDAANEYGIAAVFFIFLFTAIFGATWLTVPWLYPAEIFPLEVRAKGNAWGVVGWSVGNGMLTLLCPVMFDALDEKTLYIFGICNIITIPMVYCLYPETNQRTLEEINLIFSSDSIWTWDAERNFEKLKMQDEDGLLRDAGVGEGEQTLLDPETGLPRESYMPAVLGGISGSDEGLKEAQVKMKRLGGAEEGQWLLEEGEG